MALPLVTTLLLSGACLPVALLAFGAPQDSESTLATDALPDFDVQAVIEHVSPSAEELAWLELPWLPTLREGLVAGTAQQKPVLLWAMNGHPLAST